MKKIIQHSLLMALLAVAGGAHALSFDTMSGTPFTEYFSVKPNKGNAFVITVSGLGIQYSDLNFSIASGPTIIGSLNKGSWVAAFNDARNKDFILAKDTSYRLKVTGHTNTSIPGGFGQISITTLNGAVTPVPEPEALAMLLAGLGLMGAIARRRNKTQT